MPNFLTGVDVNVIDKSQFILPAPNTVVYGVIDVFEKGNREPVLVSSVAEYREKFGKALNKSIDIAIVNLLETASCFISNIVSDNAVNGSLFLTPDGIVAPQDIISANYAFNILVEEICDGSSKDYTITLPENIFKETATITYTVDNVVKSIKINNDYTISSNDVSGTYNENTKTIELSFTTAPQGKIIIEGFMKIYAILYTKSPKSWGNRCAISIEKVQNANYFKIVEYLDGVVYNTTNCSFYEDAVDGFGNNIYIGNVLKLFDVKVNAGIPSNVNYTINYASVSVKNANDGDTITKHNVGIYFQKSLQYFADKDYSWDIFVGNGLFKYLNVSETVYNSLLVSVFNLVNNKMKFAFLDTYYEDSDKIKTWAENLTGCMRVSLYTPQVFVGYEGMTYLLPVSSLVAYNYAKYCVKNGQKYLPPAGLERGSLNIVKLSKYYGDTEVLMLHDVEVNPVRYFRSSGNVLFSDFTFQKYLSATSFINSVLVINDVVKDLKEQLLAMNFSVIDGQLYAQLYSMLDSYMKSMTVKDGAIDKYVIELGDIEEAKITREVKVKIVFSIQGIATRITVDLVYTNNNVISSIA